MNKIRQRLILAGLVLAFIIIVPSIVYYSDGYRLVLDSGNKIRVVKTGGISIKTYPAGASVFIDSKLAKKTNLLIDQALITDLLPKSYKVLVTRDGYLPWEKTLTVREQEVTSAKSILFVKNKIEFSQALDLLPNKPTTTLPVKEYLFSPNNSDIAVITKSDTAITLGIINLERGMQKEILSASPRATQIENIRWSNDSQRIMADYNVGYKKGFLIADIGQDQKPTTTSDIIKAFGILANQDIKNISQIAQDSVCYTISDDIIWVSKDGFVYRSAISGKTAEVLSLKPLTLNYQECNIAEKNNDLFVFVGDSLFYLDRANSVFEKIADKTKEISFSNDESKVAFNDNGTIIVFYLKNKEFEDVAHKQGDKIIVSKLESLDARMSWIGDNHLLINDNSKIIITETDNRDKVNMATIAQYDNPIIFFNQRDKKAYILSQGTLYLSERIVP